MHLIVSLLAILVAAMPALAEEPLTLKVFTASEMAFRANATLVLGKTEAALIDVPGTRSDAYRLAADILDSGRKLKYVYITHPHPDHYLGLDVFAQVFPSAQLIASPEVVAGIWHSLPEKMKKLGPLLGQNAPVHPVVPSVWNADSFQIEGQDIKVLGPMQGDYKNSSAIYVPSIKALIAGDLVFSGMHLWLAEHSPQQRKAWIRSLEQLTAMKPAKVVAGHGQRVPGQPDDAEILQFTYQYLTTFDTAAQTAKTSKELVEKMRADFPSAQDVLDNFLLTNSAKVAVGEMPPWD